jgi:hypothetical protein
MGQPDPGDPDARALVGPSGDRHLLDAVFGNTDHLFAFNCAATDAKVLAPELGAPLEPADLIELGDSSATLA